MESDFSIGRQKMEMEDYDVTVSFFRKTPYHFHLAKDIGGRKIYKFVFDSRQKDAVAIATAAIAQFIKNNPHFISLLPKDQKELTQQIQERPFLTLNGRVICLSLQEHILEGEEAKYTDQFFTCDYLVNPIRCQQGHHHEQKHAQLWTEVLGKNLCPSRENHQIDCFDVDTKFQKKLRSRFQLKKRSSETEIELAEQIKKLKLENDKLKNQYHHISSHVQGNQKNPDPALLGSFGGKALVKGAKLGIELSAKEATKKGMRKAVEKAATRGIENVGKAVGKKVSEEGAKKLASKAPFIGLAIGCGSASYRLYHGQPIRALGEIASGVASTFPGIGTAVSLSLDAIITIYDIRETMNTPYQPVRQKTENGSDLLHAYYVLGLSPFTVTTKEEVDERYKKLSPSTHPDSMEQHGDYVSGFFNNQMQQLNAAKEILYKAHGWN